MKQHLLRRVERFTVRDCSHRTYNKILHHYQNLYIVISCVSTNNQSNYRIYDKQLGEVFKFHIVVFVDFLSILF